ncbi:5-oxoprolinase subunit PxpB [Gramella lutea]|uniref:5-oxoprolinase subunit PxpB n=1 Tax=Christiangramia lutea TaxID=1607951 RepID=A0A9X1V3H5_9FLAO|nr:5-oxoprolinase subunit PxpB [Christiangramia lutea]MCH4823702.1 5-oxoprolinase subunit PxpB [Christiangramia lutea]
MMVDFPKITPLGDRAILINFEKIIDEKMLEKVLFYKNLIENSQFKQKVEVVNTYNSLLISYVFAIEDVYSEVLRIKQLVRQANIPKNMNYKIFTLPVCYNEEFGLDLKLISEDKNLKIDEIIKLHTKPFYRIYFTGFLPGFLYLGGLDERLKISRKESPRRSVDKGSVGIGENQTGIYPKNSPGGWQILGKCPVDLFRKNERPPSPFSAGDKIKFEAVSITEYQEIIELIEAGEYKLKVDNYES